MDGTRNSAYAVDILANVVRAISRSEPVFFQRDGALYIASAEGFGKMGYGLSMKPNNPENNSWRKEFSEIIESEDILIKREYKNEESECKKGEKDYLLPIIFNKDSCSEFSLESIAKTASALRKLADDDKIRMVSHESQYHSHKHGYACDGTDVWLSEARVMNRNRYLEIMREKEDEFFEALSKNNQDFARLIYSCRSDAFAKSERAIKLPDAMIITPRLMMTFPRGGKLDSDCESRQTWTTTSNLRRRELPFYSEVNSYQQSPFAMLVRLNEQTFNAANAGEFGFYKEKLSDLSNELASLEKVMPDVGAFLTKINNAHNLACKLNIEWRESLKK